MLITSAQQNLMLLLAWYREMGVDSLVSETPIDWLTRVDTGARRCGVEAASAPTATILPASAIARPPAPAATARQFAAMPPEQLTMAARAAARSAQSLDELRATLADFDGCSLKATARNLCFYRGEKRARLVLIGEAPGRDEDIEGKPFVGRAGQLLDKMLAAIQVSQDQVHITNIVYWRPPGNRTPTPQEAQVCRPFLERQIELVGPEFIVLLGGAAAKHILDVAEGIMRIRGKWRDVQIGGRRARAMATLHPAYLLRSPAAKRLAWRDLLEIKRAINI
jgi:DNA polymerase